MSWSWKSKTASIGLSHTELLPLLRIRDWCGKRNKPTKMTNQEKVGFILLSFLLVVAWLLGGCSSNDPPTDNALIETFKNREAEFEMLTRMFLEDKNLEKVASLYIRPEGATVSEQRLQEYRKLLKELDLDSIEGSEKAVFLTAYTSDSFPDDGVYKGYVYFSNGIPGRLEAPVVDSLDELKWEPNNIAQFYRKINEKWYLWFLA